VAENVYTRREAVQVKIKKRWLNGIVVELGKSSERADWVRVELDTGPVLWLKTNAPELRKWGEGKRAPDKPVRRGKRQRIRYCRAGFSGAVRRP
jgi:hypothetical protein